VITAKVLASMSLAALPQDSVQRDSVIVLEEYVITATRAAPVVKYEQPAALTVVAPTLSRRASGATAANLLRDLTGVQVQQTSAGQGAVILRGMVGNQVLMLVDGVPMNNGTYRDGPGQYLATIDPETIERIEILRGPASSLYGSDAQGGVLNVITRPHQFRGPGSARVAMAGSTADRGYRTRVAGHIGSSWSLGLGGTYLQSGDLRAGGSVGRQAPTGFDAWGVDGQFTWSPAERHTLTATVQHFTMDGVPRYDRYVEFRAPAPGPDAEHVFRPQARQLAYVRHRFQNGTTGLATVDITASLAVQREGRDRIRRLDTGPDSIRTRWRDDVYTPGVSAVATSIPVLGSQPILVTWGAEWYHDALASNGYDQNLNTGATTALERGSSGGNVPTGNFPDGSSADRIGAFVTAEVQVSERLRLSAGGRFSAFRNQANVGTAFGGVVSNSNSALTGQLGTVVSIARYWYVAARVAQGFRAPNLYDLTRVGPVPGGIQLPNPNARPERSWTGDLSLRYEAERTAFDITAYYTRVSDFIDRGPGTFNGDTLFDGERVFQGVNVGTARVRGLEAEAARQVGPVQLRTTLLYTVGDQDDAGGVTEPMAKIPPLSGSVAARWTPRARPWWLEYALRWAAKQDRLGSRDLADPRIPPGGTPGYTAHGIRAGATLPNGVDVALGLENLGNELYRDHASGVDAPGRHLWAGASWTLGW
jgi:outer membrane receptor protein involved in Fe transport